MTVDAIGELLKVTRTIAVVGASPRPERPVSDVAAYLMQAGYAVVPVNPRYAEVLGVPCYPDLGAIPADVRIDLVDVFVRPEVVPAILDQTLARGVRAIWLQPGAGNPAVQRRAAEAGLQVVAERCIMTELRRRPVHGSA